jgi:4-hydroxybenzoate polyprenyltransferase
MVKKIPVIVEKDNIINSDKYINRLSNFFTALTSSSIFIALNGMIVTMFSSMLYEIEAKTNILVIAFLATFSAYNMNKITDKVEDSINSPSPISRHPLQYIILSITALTLCFFMSASLGIEALVIITTSFVVSILYSIKLTDSFPRFKEIMGLKSILVASSWAFTGAFLPAISQNVDGERIFLTFTYIFIQILVNTILCDIRDINGDLVSGVKTVPIVLGIDKTKKLLIIINSLILPWLIYCLLNSLFTRFISALYGGMIYGYLIIWAFARKKCDRLLVELVIDGEWIPLVIVMALL